MNQITKHITGTLGLLVALAGCGQLAAQYRDLDCGTGAFSPMQGNCVPPGMQGYAGQAMAQGNCVPPGMQGYAGQPMGPMAGPCGPNGFGCGPGLLRSGKVKAGLFGWIPPKFTGSAIEGYHPHANAYPHPYCPQPANPFEGYPGIAPGGGYVNEGGTCCGPHWYDFMVEGVGMVRNGGTNVALTTDGIADPPNPLDPDIVVLSTDDADFNYQGGYRAGGRFQINAVMAVEATYLGGLDWSSSAAATSNNNGLFSIFSNYGNNPDGGYEDTDQATLHTVSLTSDLQSVDALLRRMWVSPSQKHSGSWTFGVRYYQINESLLHTTLVQEHMVPGSDPPETRPDGFLNYNLDVRNDLVGPELGIEGAHCLTPGITVLGELRGGIYGNRASQNSVIDSTTIRNQNFGQPLFEEASDTEVAYGASAKAIFLWQFHPLAKIRGGYEVLYLDGVATAPANFNSQPFDEFGAMGARTVFINQRDQVIYHGFNVGLELGW